MPAIMNRPVTVISIEPLAQEETRHWGKIMIFALEWKRAWIWEQAACEKKAERLEKEAERLTAENLKTIGSFVSCYTTFDTYLMLISSQCKGSLSTIEVMITIMQSNGDTDSEIVRIVTAMVKQAMDTVRQIENRYGQ